MRRLLLGATIATLSGIGMSWITPATPAAAQIAVDDPRLKTDQFDYEYVEPKNPAHLPLYNMLKEARLLEKLQEFLSPLRLPQRIIMKTEGCDGVINAYFSVDTIKVCYEYFDYIMKYSPKMVRQGLTPRDAMIGPTVDVFLHELGHGIVRTLEIPFFGREEDVADYIATYILLKFSKDDARRLILGASFVGGNEALEEQGKAPELVFLADTHALPAQRYFNRWCMAYGADQELFGDAVEIGMLPPNRAKVCRYEYQTNSYAFERLVQPYIDKTLRSKVASRHWFTFESPVAATMSKPPLAAKEAETDAAKAAR